MGSARYFYGLACIVFLLLGSLLGACKPKDRDQPPRPPPAVKIITVAPQSIPFTLEYPAQIAGSREVEVRVQVSGILEKQNYREGALVRAGESLFQINSTPYRAALTRAEAELSAASARLLQTKRDAKRNETLFDAGAISQQQYNDSQSLLDIATSEQKRAKAALLETGHYLAQTHVKAPISGITSRALKDVGNLIADPGVLLTTISKTDPVYVNFGIPEGDQLHMDRAAAKGQLRLPGEGLFDIAMLFEDGTRHPVKSRIAFRDLRVDPKTGTSDARAEMPNPDQILRPGQFVRVLLEGAEWVEVITVPQRAVLESADGHFVYVLAKENKAEMRLVTVGSWVGRDWIISEGLVSGEQVIVEGVMKLAPGITVQVVKKSPPTPDMGQGQTDSTNTRSAAR